MKKSTLIIIAVVGLIFLHITAGFCGTLIYEDRSIRSSDPKKRLRTLSKIKLVSISEGLVIIEKDGATRRIPLKRLKEYYDTDIKGGDSGDFDDNTANYTVQIVSDAEPPKSGYKRAKEKGKNRKRLVPTEFKIEYNIIKQDKYHKTDRVRRPYFYLYVYTSGADEYKNRNIFKFYYPKQAKVKNKTYNRAEIMEAVTSFKRTIIHLNEEYSRRYFSGKHRKLTGVGSNRTAVIKFKGIKSRRILAYHLEVWGKNDIVLTRDWKMPGVRIGKKWWIR